MTAPALTTLRDACEFILDGTHGSPERTETGIPVLSALNVKGGQLSLATDRYTSEREYLAFHRRLAIKPGDVLLTIVGTIGRTAVVDTTTPFVFQRSVAVLRPRLDRLHSRFLFHLLNTAAIKRQLDTRTNQSAQAGVYLGKLGTVEIPLPPLAVQKRIAAVLDKADDLRGKRRQALATLDTLLQSVFLNMFGDPVTNPKKWPVRRAGDIGTVQGGLTLNQRRKSLPVTAAYLRVANVQRGFIDTAVMKSIGLTPEERERTALQSGDLLVVEGNGNPNEIGRAAVWGGSIADCVHQNHLIRIRPDPASLTSDYAVAFVNSDGGKRYFNRAGNTTSGLVTINISVVRNIPFPVPPIDLQRQYSRSVASLNDQRGRIEESLAQLDALFAALQSAAFAGTLFNGEMAKVAASQPAHPTPRPTATTALQ